MKKGFTLLELIVVILIIGILGTFGFVQYQSLLEKGRFAEARANLGMLRQLQIAYNLTNATYASLAELGSGLPDGNDNICNDGIHSNTSYYFQYDCISGTGLGSGLCAAHRCGSGGKIPNKTGANYVLNLSIDGTFQESGTP